MKVTILIGFSCTGKSTIVDELKRDARFSHVSFKDTDKQIAREYNGHIYNI